MARTLVLFTLMVLATGCVSPADLLGRGQALESARKDYTEAVRWGRLDHASRFVDPAQREAYRSIAETFGTLRITDFEVSEYDFDGADEVEVQVTYRAYSLSTLTERRFQERQTWFRKPGMKSNWRLHTDLAEALQRLVDGRS